MDISFEYPITAIAGKNGAGKSTILALACCAFHAKKGAFKLPKRKNPYYTFSDFFIQHGDEVSPQGLEIRYYIAYNDWNPHPLVPNGVGIGQQVRRKIKGGKWNDYDSRVKRSVVFLGIERIVPHSERSQSRSYSRVFKSSAKKGWEEKVMQVVGRILGKTYDDFRYVEHSKYSLPIVRSGATVYSGFNMGAGENALFEIFSTIYSAGKGALLVLDEIELGLHAEAQRKLVNALKEVCLEMNIQIVCTTHSKEIFDCLPNDARFYVENVANKTRVTQGVSSEFAFMKLSAITGQELDILVEDEVAKAILVAVLPAGLRARVTITVIGSGTALARQLAAIYVRADKKPVLAVFDGDQLAKHGSNLKHARKMAEKVADNFNLWYSASSVYLPGDTWPEAWLLQKSREVVSDLAEMVGCSAGEMEEYIEYGLQAGKHNEFYEVAKHVGLERAACLQMFTLVVAKNFAHEFGPVAGSITALLDS